MSGAVAVRVGVFFGRTAVRGPARVSDAIGTVERLEPDGLFEVAQLALGAPDLQAFAVAGDSDAGGVVSAIFESLEPVDDHGHNLFTTYVADNSAHFSLPVPSTQYSVLSC